MAGYDRNDIPQRLFEGREPGLEVTPVIDSFLEYGLPAAADIEEGVDHWRHLKPWLTPLEKALGDVVSWYSRHAAV